MPDHAAERSPLLKIAGLQKRFGGVNALDELELELQPHRSLCLIGPNGCGKTSLLRAITGEIRPDAGSVMFEGETLNGLAPHAIARLGIARKFQSPAVIEAASVRENIALALHGRHGLRYRPRNTEIEAALSQVGLEDSLEAMAGTLAHGQKQWLEIAMLLAQQPRLLLLDEPTAGMSPAETDRTVALLKRLMRDDRLPMIVIEHDLRFVAALEIETAVMLRGRIVRHGAYDDIRRDPFVEEIYFGKAA